MAEDTDSFLSRWSRRKAGVRTGVPVAAEPVVVPAPAAAMAQPAAEAPPAAPDTETVPATAGRVAPATPPPPTMADVALLTRDADYTRYLVGNVSPEVKNAALKHLFTDAHFNVMDGLDIYIGDYNTPDPMPPGMLRQMVQSKLLGLFDDEVEADTKPPVALTADDPAAAAPPLPADSTLLAADENPDLQLQPDDDAGRPGTEAGPGAHAGRPD